MRSAELFDDNDPAFIPIAEPVTDALALKQEIAERLAAHRARRSRSDASNLVAIPSFQTGSRPSRQPAASAENTRDAASARTSPKPVIRSKSRSNHIAAAVAERYAHSPSYRDFLAAEAARAIEEANATAEIAARNAQAVTAVQQQFLAELDLWGDPASSPCLETSVPALPHASPPYGEASGNQPAPHALDNAEWETSHAAALVQPQAAAVTQVRDSGLTVRLYEDVGLRQLEPRITSGPFKASTHSADEADALTELEDEIAFRHAPVSLEPAEPPTTIAANLIEFPRQLVATRKARPRLAEGPLREEADATPAAAQLRIFEVDPSQFFTAPATAPETSLPEWSTIHLDAAPAHFDTPVGVPAATHLSYSDPAIVADPASLIHTALYVPLQVAPLSHRMMAAAVDGCLLGTTFLAAVCAFALAVRSLPSLPVAAITSAAALLVLFILYHLLFFTFADATPGMRYARVGLCTFSDDNPTRAQMRRRTWHILLSLCPLGLGLLWAFLDEDGLGWHDRLSRTYQRSY